MTEQNLSKKNSAARWTKALLVVSLAINLVVAFAVVGALWRFGPPPGDRENHHPKAGPALYVAALERDVRRELFQEARRQIPKGIQSHSVGLPEVLARLRATPFDAAAFGQALEEDLSHSDQRAQALRSSLTARVAAMSAEERAAYAARIEAFSKRNTKNNK